MPAFAPVPLLGLDRAEGLALHAGAATLDARRVFTPEVVSLALALHRALAPDRRRLLRARAARQADYDAGSTPDYLLDGAVIGARGPWQVAPLPADLRQRRVEITGPASDPRMVVTMLSRTADGHRADAAMLDMEDSMAPTWANVVAAATNVRDAARGTLRAEKRDASGAVVKTYALDPGDMATMMVRVRGLHLAETNVRVDGRPASAALVDLALVLVHSARALVQRGATPALYLPKMEHHLEARWWARALALAEDALDLPRSTVRVTMLIETLPAAFQMEEILFELRDHAAGLNGGRWDKIFSDIKCLRAHPDRVLADRATIGMNRPWMHAYARELVRVCHRHGALAMGGMAAFTPGRDPETRAVQTAKVVEDKAAEAALGHDGCWVSHPFFIGPAVQPFLDVLGEAPNQLGAGLDAPPRPDLLPESTGPRTMGGLRTNVRVGIAYLKGYREGTGCVAWDGLMEDLATLEISRAQTHQWLRHAITLDTGEMVTPDLVRRVFREEAAAIAEAAPDAERTAYAEAAAEAEGVFLAPDLAPFLALASPLAQLAHPAPGTSGDGHVREPVLAA